MISNHIRFGYIQCHYNSSEVSIIIFTPFRIDLIPVHPGTFAVLWWIYILQIPFYICFSLCLTSFSFSITIHIGLSFSFTTTLPFYLSVFILSSLQLSSTLVSLSSLLKTLNLSGKPTVISHHGLVFSQPSVPCFH